MLIAKQTKQKSKTDAKPEPHTADVGTPQGLAWLTRVVIGFVEKHPGVAEDKILAFVDDAVDDGYGGDLPSARAVDLLYELVHEGTFRWGAPRRRRHRDDMPLRYWLARRTGDYACETAPACLCSGSDEDCQCTPRSRTDQVTRCESCDARMPEFEATDHRASRPFEGAPLHCPGADPAVCAS